ncbi:DUF6701 domain-containing protein [Pseudomonas fluorescens]|uniref:DUF6701 domain-containing protein n=1 Tax=Pseudomonas fluorescens TaxID=294 RepID=A0A5E7FBH9_PSEFL|nr:DUF6701 domain-containing protein [Pseudomonas fluorescens]VVO34843.1 hypothetical protein PS723_05291 [Pseudomonas fluorescens]
MSRQAFIRRGLCVVLLAGLALTSLAHAATTYTFSLTGTNAPCSGAWTRSGNTFTCSGQMNLNGGDALATGTLIVGNITVVANQGFSLNSNTIGTSSNTVTLVSAAGAINVQGSGSTFSASVSSTDGAISMNNATVTGSVQTARGAMTLISSTIAGDALAGGAITATRSSVGANLISSTGAITLTDVKVGGFVEALGAVTLQSDSEVSGALTSRAGALTLTRSSVGGDAQAYGAITGTDTQVNGNLISSTGAITLDRGSVGNDVRAEGAITATATPVTGNLTSNAGAITLTRGSVGGNILAAGVITATDAPVTGNLTSSTAAITLVRGSVSGDVNAAAAVTTTDTCVGGNVRAGGAITLTRTSVGGNVQAGGAITSTHSCIEGTIKAGGATTITGSCSSGQNHSSCKATPPTKALDHFAFSYGAAALTCNPQPITISACSSADCSLYADPVSITLSPTSGWTAIPPAVMSGNTLTFSGGSAQATLRSGSAGNVSLAVLSSVPASTRPVVCSTSGCTIGYAESGFIFDVPTLIAARPQSNIALRAVKKSDASQACVPSFSSVTRKLSFTSAYLDPGTGSQPVLVNGTSVTGSPRELDLAFDSTGSARLTVRYDDAGQMMLTASYQGSAANNDAGLTMSGNDVFVAKPYGLCLQTDSTCSVAGVSSDCKVFPNVRAGDAFPLRIQAVGWLADGEPLTAAALCSNHIVTGNFRMADIPLVSAVVAPVGGDNGTASPSAYRHESGSQTTTLTSISEVGVFRLSATPLANAYFGETVSGGQSGLVGRLIPAYLGVQASASLTPSCNSSFSYQGQPMAFAAGQEPDLKVTGFNRAASITRNYDRGAFWRLATPVPNAYTSNTGKLSLDASGRLTSSGGASLTRGGVDDGDGTQSYRWRNETLRYTPAILPLADDRPFIAAIVGGFSAASLTDSDGACFGGGNGCSAYHYDFANSPGSEVRLGRLRLGNAHGSEYQNLDLPLSIETWQNVAGGSFRVEGLDTCTTATVLQAPGLSSYTGQLGQKDYGNDKITLIAPSAGLGLLRLQAPGINGSVLGQLAAMPSWLFYDWNGKGREAATGLARFGIYRGSPSMIFHREVYR